MKKAIQVFAFVVLIFVSLAALPVAAQNAPFHGVCENGGRPAAVSGTKSTNTLLGVVPSCLVTVYYHGTSTLVTIYSDAAGDTFGNPFTADALGSAAPGSWAFYAPSGTAYDITMSNSTTSPPPGFSTPVTVTEQAGGSSSGSGVTSFSSGDLSPLFTTSVDTPTTTPAQTFTLSTTGNFNFFGNFSGSTAAPSWWTLVAGAGVSLTTPGGNVLKVSAPSSTLQVAATSPIEVNGGAGPVDNGTATISCPTCGDLGSDLQFTPTPPISGQYVVITPTAAALIQGGLGPGCGGTAATGSSVIGNSLNSVIAGNTSCGNGLTNNTWGASWTFAGALAAQAPQVVPANVTAIYAFSLNSFGPYFPGTSFTSVSCTAPGSGAVALNGSDSWSLAQFTALLTTATGSNIDSTTCQATTLYSTPIPSGTDTTLNVPSIGLIVYYTGTAPPAQTAVSVVPPLNYNPATNSLSIDPNAVFSSDLLLPVSVAQLALMSPFPADQLAAVNNGANATDCTAGGGSYYVQCVSTGTAWAAYSGGGSVSSVFGRTGAVAAQTGDYTVAQITGAAPLASPALTGTPTAPTQSCGSSTAIANEAYVAACASGGGGSSLGYTPSAGSGLVLNIAAGQAVCDNNSPYSYSGGTLTLTASTTNYVYLDPTNECAPAFNTQGFFPNQIPIATVVTGASSITSVTANKTPFKSTNTFVPDSQISKGGGAYTFGDSPMYGGADSTGCPAGLSGGAPPQDGLTSDCNFVGNLLVAAYGNQGRVFPRSIPGYTDAAYADSTFIDVGNMQVFPYTNYGDSAQPDSFVQGGGSDSCLYPLHNASGSCGTLTNYATAIPASITSIVAWLGAPQYGKTIATNTAACVKTSGTWTADNSFQTGVALQATGSAVLTCTTPYAVSNDVIAVWKAVSGGSATATFAIDGTTVDTWNSGAAGTISTAPGSTTMWWGSRYALSSTPTTHVYTITVTSGTFSFAFFASPQPTAGWLGLTYPRVFFGVDAYEIGSTIAGYITSTTTQMASDGWNVQNIELNNYVPDMSLGASSLIFAGGTYPNGRVCPASTVGYPHPGDCGHLFWSWGYLTAAGKTPFNQGVGSFNGRIGQVVPQTGDYDAAEVTNAASTVASNTYHNGTQTFYTPSYSGVGVINRGNTSAGSPVSFVQQEQNSGGSQTLITSSNIGAGDTIIVLVYGDSTAEATLSDTQGNTFTTLGYDGGRHTWFISTNMVGGADTLTASISGADSYSFGFMEFTSSVVSAAFSLNTGGACSSFPPCSLGPVTLTAANGAIVTGMSFTHGTQSVENGSLIWMQQLDSGSESAGYVLESAAGSFSQIWNSTSSGANPVNTWTIGLTPGGGTPQTADLVQNQYEDGTTLSGVKGPGLPYNTPLTYSQLTGYLSCSSGSEGTHAAVKDSTVNTWGSTITGGGSYHVPAYCNGTNWIVQ